MAKSVKITPEITRVQEWIKNEIYPSNVCTPLTKLFSENNKNWKKIYNESISINTFRNEKDPNSKVSAAFFDFIATCLIKEKQTIVTSIFILPDFDTNSEYDLFMATMKQNVMNKLIEQPKILEGAIPKIIELLIQQGKDPASNIEVFRNNRIAAINLVEGAFNPVYFYGKPLTDKDLDTFTYERGDKNRYRILSQAPFYLFQSINQFNPSSKRLVGQLDRTKLRTRNTNYALEKLSNKE